MSIPDAARKIGYNTPVTVGARTLHVQTEVVGRDRLVIRTTVLERGVVQFSDSSDCPTEGVDVEGIRRAARAQHEACIVKANAENGV
jgi:hypothetical protein